MGDEEQTSPGPHPPPPTFSPKQAEDENPAHIQDGNVEPLRQYSNEARAYHARYAALSEAHDKGQHNVCREGCLDLLTEPKVPYYTRIQILQMLSTLLAPPAAQSCIEEAAAMLAKMDNSKFQVQLLARDNEMMRTDLEASEVHGLNEDAQNSVVDSSAEDRYREFDRVLQEQRAIGTEARRTEEDQAVRTGNIVFFGEALDREDERRAEQEMTAQQDIKIQNTVAGEDKDQTTLETPLSERLSPTDSMFSRLSPADSMFSRLSPTDSMFSRLSPSYSMFRDHDRPGTSGSAGPIGIEAVLAKDDTTNGTRKTAMDLANEAAINEFRARTEADRSELAALEKKMAEIIAARTEKKDGIQDPGKDDTQQPGKAIPIRTGKYPGIGIGQPMGNKQERAAETNAGTDGPPEHDDGHEAEKNIDNGVVAKKAFRNLSARALGVLGMAGLADKKGGQKGDSKEAGSKVDK